MVMHESPSTIDQYVDDQTSSNDLSLVVDLPMMNIETICWRTSLTLHLSQRGKPEATLFHQLHNVLCEKNTFIEYPHSGRKVFMLQHSNRKLGIIQTFLNINFDTPSRNTSQQNPNSSEELLSFGSILVFLFCIYNVYLTLTSWCHLLTGEEPWNQSFVKNMECL